MLTYTSFMVVQPSAKAIQSIWFSSATETCHKKCCKTENSENSPKKGCCSDAVCNPFMTCSCCIQFTLTNRLQIVLFQNNQDISEYWYIDNLLPAHFHKDFHPPEII